MFLSMSVVMLFFVAISIFFVYTITENTGLDNESRFTLIANLLGLMSISLLVCMVLIYKQVQSFVVPFRNLSGYFHSVSNEGLSIESFSLDGTHAELDNLTKDLNVLIRNVNTLMENVRLSADRVSDLSGACVDMLDIVDFDSKMVGRRMAEMLESSKGLLQLINESDKKTSAKADEFSHKFKKVEEAQKAIEHTIMDAKNSMKVLNDVSANLRRVGDFFYIRKS